MIHSFLLIGQSNAAGRGFYEEAEPLDNCGGRLLVLRNGRWQPMYRPVNGDRSFSGTCLAETFAKAYAEAHPDVSVGIIPCADGGTSLEQWAPGSLLFDNAVNCTRLAMRTSYLVGALWHQGEGDCALERYPLYHDRFVAMKEAFRRELALPRLPFLVGGLGEFLALRAESPALVNYPHINAALVKAAEEDENCAYVDASGLPSNPDRLHFSAAALKDFGIRFYNVFEAEGFSLGDTTEAKEDDSKRSKMESL